MYTAAHFREQADQFRELAKGADPESAARLLKAADDYEAEALRLENKPIQPIG
jgi:hypothetical protein